MFFIAYSLRNIAFYMKITLTPLHCAQLCMFISRISSQVLFLHFHNHCALIAYFEFMLKHRIPYFYRDYRDEQSLKQAQIICNHYKLCKVLPNIIEIHSEFSGEGILVGKFQLQKHLKAD